MKGRHRAADPHIGGKDHIASVQSTIANNNQGIWHANGSGTSTITIQNTLLSQNGKCMDVAAGSTANGAAVQLYTCNGTGAQQFTLNAAGDLVNPQANRCVDIVDVNPNAGAHLQLWDCAGTANQKWHQG